MNLRFLFFLIIFFVGIEAYQSIAQTNQDISSVNLDNVSDQQLSQILNKAHSNGLTDDQVVQQAISGGMPQSEAAKLKSRISALRNNASDSQ
jgi:hypothetical protein